MRGSESRGLTRLGRRPYLAALGTGLLAGLAGCSFGAQVAVRAEELESSGDGAWGRQVKLTATDDSVSQFGRSVALAGDGATALVTADHHEDDDGFEPGPAYVLERTDGDWGVLAELTPEGGDSEGNFGGPGGSSALSTDGTTAIVGADKADAPNGSRAGAAYVFERGDGGWETSFELQPDDVDTQDFFGSSVALSDDGRLAFVGAWNDEGPSGGAVGTVAVFERTEAGWRRRTTLAPDREAGSGRFGWSVALAGGTAVVGDPGAEADGTAAGAAHVFERTGGGWRREQRLVPDDGDAGDFFGGSAALEGETAVIGAPEDDDPNGERGGSAYVFERGGDGWRQTAKLVPDDGDPIDLFGVAVALSGDTALVGARVDEDPNGEAAGSAYVFEQADGGWRQRVKLAAADGESHDVFGRSVALEDGTALVGSTRGGAYVFG